jgi:hypothetical protein
METRYQALVAAVERAINEADPIGLLEAGAPTDEYGPAKYAYVVLLLKCVRFVQRSPEPLSKPGARAIG